MSHRTGRYHRGLSELAPTLNKPYRTAWKWSKWPNHSDPAGGVNGANRVIEVSGYGLVNAIFKEPTWDFLADTKTGDKKTNKPTFYISAKSGLVIKIDAGMQWEPEPSGDIKPGWLLYLRVTQGVSRYGGSWGIWRNRPLDPRVQPGFGQATLEYDLWPDGRAIISLTAGSIQKSVGPVTVVWPKTSSGLLNTSAMSVGRVVGITQGGGAVLGSVGKAHITLDGSIVHNLYLLDGSVAKIKVSSNGVVSRDGAFTPWPGPQGDTKKLLPDSKNGADSFIVDFESPSTPRSSDGEEVGPAATTYPKENVRIDLSNKSGLNGKMPEPGDGEG